jgi:hypothetical protein
MKYKLLIIFLYFGYTLKTKCRNMATFTIFFLASADWKTRNSLDFLFYFLNFAFWRNFAKKEAAWDTLEWEKQWHHAFMESNLEGKHSFAPG